MSEQKKDTPLTSEELGEVTGGGNATLPPPSPGQTAPPPRPQPQAEPGGSPGPAEPMTPTPGTPGGVG